MIISDEPVVTLKLSQFEALRDRPMGNDPTVGSVMVQDTNLVAQILARLIEDAIASGKYRPDTGKVELVLPDFDVRVTYHGSGTCSYYATRATKNRGI